MLGEKAREVIHRCRLLAACSEQPGFTTRTFLSAPMRDVHAHLTGWMQDSGMTVSLDHAGNLRGVYPDAHMIDKHWGGVSKDANGQPVGGDAPAYGLWARHVRGLTLINYKVTPVISDPRPKFVLTTVQNLCVNKGEG